MGIHNTLIRRSEADGIAKRIAFISKQFVLDCPPLQRSFCSPRLSGARCCILATYMTGVCNAHCRLCCAKPSIRSLARTGVVSECIGRLVKFVALTSSIPRYCLRNVFDRNHGFRDLLNASVVVLSVHLVFLVAAGTPPWNDARRHVFRKAAWTGSYFLHFAAAPLKEKKKQQQSNDGRVAGTSLNGGDSCRAIWRNKI